MEDYKIPIEFTHNPEASNVFEAFDIGMPEFAQATFSLLKDYPTFSDAVVSLAKNSISHNLLMCLAAIALADIAKDFSQTITKGEK